MFVSKSRMPLKCLTQDNHNKDENRMTNGIVKPKYLEVHVHNGQTSIRCMLVFLLLFASSRSLIAICFSLENCASSIAFLLFLFKKRSSHSKHIGESHHYFVAVYYYCFICFVLIFVQKQTRSITYITSLARRTIKGQPKAEETGIDNTRQWQREFSLCLCVLKNGWCKH